MNIQDKLKKQADLYRKLDRSLELQACLDKDIWKGGAVQCHLWRCGGYDILKNWEVKLFNEEVVLPKISLAELKVKNKRLLKWVLQTNVMQEAINRLSPSERARQQHNFR